MPSTLVSADGTEQAIALPVSLASCSGVTIRNTGLASSGEWCLRLTGLTPGYSVTGMVLAPSAIVDLTVEPRDPWLPWPALIVASGVFLAGLVLVAPAIIARRALKLELWRELERNERHRMIAGLDRNWVKSLVAAGKCTIEPGFVDTIIEVIKIGPTRLRADRGRLGRLIADSLLPHDKTLLIAASEQAKDAPPLREDFLSDDGKPCETPPEKWLERISRAERIVASTDRLRRRLSQVNDTEERNRLESRLNRLVDQVAEAGPEESAVDAELASADGGVSQASRAIRGAASESVSGPDQLVQAEIAVEEPPLWFKVIMGGAATALRWLLLGPFPPTSMYFQGIIQESYFVPPSADFGAAWRTFKGFSKWRYVALVWLTYYGVAAVLMVLAAAAVFSISYINTGAFGTPADYFKLGGAAFGTTALTGIVGLLPRRRRP
jgi:hypothetical protein